MDENNENTIKYYVSEINIYIMIYMYKINNTKYNENHSTYKTMF